MNAAKPPSRCPMPGAGTDPPWERGGPPWRRGGRWERWGPPWWAAGPQRPAPTWTVVILPVLLAVVQLMGTLGAARHDPDDGVPLDAWAIVLVLAGPVVLLARTRLPVETLLVVAAVTVTYFARAYPGGPIVLSLAVALFGAATRGHRSWAWGTGAAILVCDLAGGWHDGRVRWGAFAAITAWTLVVLAVAEIARVRRQSLAEVRRKYAEVARRRASEERLSIARELHDVLAHNISLINVQAGVALHLIDSDPQQARTALTAIKQASKETLREMRSVLGVLRQVDEHTPRAPAPSLSRMDELLAATRAAGLEPTLEVTGERRPLPASVEAAAFRIAQEALTNVGRHSTARAARVTLAYTERELRVAVHDDGPARPGTHADSGGNGIPGMIERAHALGGELTAVTTPGGGFRVTARLPLPPSIQERP